MMRFLILAFLLLLPGATVAVEPKLVPDVSQRQIKIQTGFTGARLLLFGAIIYPRGVAPEGQVDVAVVLRGPTQAITLREKQKIAGIWVHADSNDFRSPPTYYAVASSRTTLSLRLQCEITFPNEQPCNSRSFSRPHSPLWLCSQQRFVVLTIARISS